MLSTRGLLSGVEDPRVRSRIMRMCYRMYGKRMLHRSQWKELLATLLCAGILGAGAFTLLRIVIPADARWLPPLMRTGAYNEAMRIVVGAVVGGAVAWIVVYRGVRHSLPKLLASLGRCPRCGYPLPEDGQALCQKCGAAIDRVEHMQEDQKPSQNQTEPRP